MPVLKAMEARGAWRWMRFMMRSKNGSSSSFLAEPPADDHDVPGLPGQSCDEGGLGRCVVHDQRHVRIDAVLAEPGQFRIERRAKSLSVDTGYRLRIVTDDKCR